MKYKLKLEKPECFLINGRNDVRELIVEGEGLYCEHYVCNCDPESVGIYTKKFYFKDCEEV